MSKNRSGFAKIKTKVLQMEEFIQSGNITKIEELINDLMESPLFKKSLKDDQAEEITVIIYTHFIKVLGMDSDAMYGHFYILLSNLLCKYGHIEGISMLFQILLDANNRFSTIYNINDSQNISELKCIDKSNEYCLYMIEQKKIISNDQYHFWINQSPENFNTFVSHLDMILNDLISFIKNKRKECFFALVDYCLLLIVSFPKLIWEFNPFKMVLSALDQSYLFKSEKDRTRLHDLVTDYKNNHSDPSVNEFLCDLTELINWTTSKPELSDKNPHPMFEELTIETAYKIAFDGFMKDDELENDENQALQQLRTILPISHQGYQQILREYTYKTQIKNSESNEISKEDFIYIVMSKALEDGILTSDEKNILAKLCKAFRLDKNTIQNLFKKAKSEVTQQTEETALLSESIEMSVNTSDEANTRYNQMINELNNEMNVSSLLKSSDYQNTESYPLVLDLFKKGTTALSDTSSNMYNIKGDLKNSEFVVTDFWCDGQQEPLVIFYVDTEAIQQIRLKFRGDEIESYFTGNIFQKMDPETYCEDEDIYLHMHNRCIDTDIVFNGITLYNNIKIFLDGMEESYGKYKIALVDLKSLKPFKVICNEGYIDASGLMSKGLKEMEDHNFTAAIKYFESLNKQNSKLQDVLFNIGYCLKCNAMKGIDSSINLKNAIIYYEKELVLNCKSIKTINNLGAIYKQAGDLDTAVEFFQQAYTLNQCYLTLLGNLTTTLISLASQSGGSKSKINGFIIKYLITGFHITGDGNILKPLIQSLGEHFQTDFFRLFRVQVVNTKYQ